MPDGPPSADARDSSETYIARRFLPYGATAGTNRNTFFGSTSTADRGNAMVTAHLASEGVTPSPDNITPEDVTVVMQQYNCLYGWTDPHRRHLRGRHPCEHENADR